jgi:hypothetical protein
MESQPRYAEELEVEPPAMGRLESVGPPAKVDGDSTAETKGDDVVGLKEDYRLGGTWVERPY